MTVRYVVDTDVISETARPRPDASVLAWLAREGSIALASVTVYELARGVERKPAGRKKAFLEAWLSRLLAAGPDVVPFDRDGALAAARLEGDARRQGRTIAPHDLFILASAKSRGLGVASRNVAHFRGFGVAVYDPFADAYA